MPSSLADPSIPGGSVRVAAEELRAIHFDVKQPITHRQFSPVSPARLIRLRANVLLRSANHASQGDKIRMVNHWNRWNAIVIGFPAAFLLSNQATEAILVNRSSKRHRP
jgi:hypothetical protein